MDMRTLLLLSVLLALMREGEGQNPKVTVQPKVTLIYVGDDVTLICNSKGGNKPTNWFINGAPQSQKEYVMLLTTVTPENNGVYECEQEGTRIEPYTLTVLELEPYAQLSPSTGGAVMTKGDGRNLVLQVDDDLKNWTCNVLRGVSRFALGLNVDKEKNIAVIFAELKDAERATFWCKKKNATDLRSNAVTLKKTELMVMLVPPAVPALLGESVALRCVVWGGPELEKVIFYKDSTIIKSISNTYTITNATQSDNGNYSCHATYSYIHISAEAALREGNSDPQVLKVIGGPPAAEISGSSNSLKCSCPHCPSDCTNYHWYHTPFNDTYARRNISENEFITVEEEGLYKCRRECGQGFSRFSNDYSYNSYIKVKPEPLNLTSILMALISIVIGLLIVFLVALKRRRGGGAIQETKRDKDKTTGGDYEQIQLKDKDQAVYHTLGESTKKDQAEGGYEPLQKRQEEGVYHTVGSVVPGEGQGEGQGESQGGYEALKSVKAEVYQTLSSDDSKKPAGEAEGGYEQLPQKGKDYETVTVEENPYEEVKKQMEKEKESGKE